MNNMENYIKEIESGQFNYELIEMVIHSLNVHAHKYKKEKKHNRERACYEKKEFIMESLLEPIEIHRIKEKKYLVFKGENHRYHEPFESFEMEDIIFFQENLETKRLTKFPFDGKRVVGTLPEELCDKFYDILTKKQYNFAPLI